MVEKIAYLIRILRTQRQALGLSQRALSHKVGLTQSHLSHLERGEIDLKTSNLVELARVLDMEVMLVPRQLTGVVEGIIAGEDLEQTPAYSLARYLDEDEV